MELFLQMFPAALVMATPIIIAALGGLFSERSGVINIALEGIMLVGAFATAVTVIFLGESMGRAAIWVGLLVGAIVGCAYSAIHAFVSIRLRADQTISGTALNMLSTGLTVFLCQLIFQGQRSPNIPVSMPKISIPILKDIPLLGRMFFNDTYPTFFIAVLLVVGAYFLLYKTRFGLRLRSCGEFPQASASMGINVAKMRYIGVLSSGALGGLAGGIMLLTTNIQFSVSVIHGVGFIALGCLVFGKWNPWGCLFTGVFFGFSEIISSYSGNIPGLSGMPTEFFYSIPYVLTILALVLFAKRSIGPKAAGQIYDAGER
ncbi:sugar ABC transporter permease [Erysipelotrichaceae bacterium MTC7]|nr:sugar ABC transporter permease [Erysipelotrichaceae bacterium MTC7]